MQNESNIPGAGSNGQDAGAAISAVATTNAGRSGVSREIHNILADIEHLIEQTTSISGEDLARAKARISERVAAAKASVEDMSGAVSERARKSAAVTNHYVHEQPWTAIGIGAAAGMLLGFLLARRA